MSSVIKVIEEKTSGVSFNSYKYCHDTGERSGIDYDDNKDIQWKDYGETEKIDKICLKDAADKRLEYPSIFKFFLDGSRHTYKVDDMSFQKNVYPIIAGQVGVGCCERIEKKLFPAIPLERDLVIVLPNKAFSANEWNQEDVANALLKDININMSGFGGKKIQINELLTYDTNKDESYDKKGVIKIQDYMIEKEKKLVSYLTAERRLNEDSYLIKDGSLDYQRISKKTNKNAINISDRHIMNNYRYVIGVSKSFDPTKCLVKGGGTNSNIIAQLKNYERTPAYRYSSNRAGVDFCIWYVRIRDARYTHSIFDGVLKVEKMIVTDRERTYGINTDDINNITAHLINERNPVCYGKDIRWANHLYPVYLTETYVKSKYLSNELFLQLF